MEAVGLTKNDVGKPAKWAPFMIKIISPGLVLDDQKQRVVAVDILAAFIYNKERKAVKPLITRRLIKEKGPNL